MRFLWKLCPPCRHRTAARQVSLCCSSALCSRAQPGSCFGLEMSPLATVEENVDAIQAPELQFTLFPSSLQDFLSASLRGSVLQDAPSLPYLSWLWVVWGQFCHRSTASLFFARVPPVQTHHWGSTGDLWA